MEKVAIILLNYLNYNDTIECVESIKKVEYNEKYIIIVDNGSNNKSLDILNEKYKYSDIHIIESSKNLGFARGNNLGIAYAREKLKCNFVLLANNDTIFKDADIITRLVEAYDKDVAVIGPRIISADKMEQNPVRLSIKREDVKNEYDFINNWKYKFKLTKYYRFLKNIKNKINRSNEINIKKKDINLSPNITSEDLILHGACMMLTKDYFKYYTGLFPDTFLYYEEDILALITKKVKLKKKFINNTSIYHKEDQSSLVSFNNSKSVKVKYQIQSMEICLKLFDMSYNEIISKYF